MVMLLEISQLLLNGYFVVIIDPDTCKTLGSVALAQCSGQLNKFPVSDVLLAVHQTRYWHPWLPIFSQLRLWY